jgi:hypothetical protein
VRQVASPKVASAESCKWVLQTHVGLPLQVRISGPVVVVWHFAGDRLRILEASVVAIRVSRTSSITNCQVEGSESCNDDPWRKCSSVGCCSMRTHWLNKGCGRIQNNANANARSRTSKFQKPPLEAVPHIHHSSLERCMLSRAPLHYLFCPTTLFSTLRNILATPCKLHPQTHLIR